MRPSLVAWTSDLQARLMKEIRECPAERDGAGAEGTRRPHATPIASSRSMSGARWTCSNGCPPGS